MNRQEAEEVSLTINSLIESISMSLAQNYIDKPKELMELEIRFLEKDREKIAVLKDWFLLVSKNQTLGEEAIKKGVGIIDKIVLGLEAMDDHLDTLKNRL